MKNITTTLICVALTACSPVVADDISKYQTPVGFELYNSTFADIRSALGDAVEFEIPESHHEIGICYQGEDTGNIVVFQSAREFGGPQKKLLGVAVHATNSLDFPCSISSLGATDLRIADLHVGLSEAEFRSMFSEVPRESDFGHLFVNLDRHRALTPEEDASFTERFGENHSIEGADTSLGVWSLIVDGRVVEFGVWQEETY